MKKIVLAGLIAATTCSSYAGDTTTLSVRGKLTTASCTPTLSNGGIVDFGTLNLGSLSSTETNQLGSKEITLTISCDGPSKVAFTAMDNRHDTLPENTIIVENYNSAGSNTIDEQNQFGLGKTAGDTGIGAYVINAASGATLDGRAGTILQRHGMDASWELKAEASLTHNNSGKHRTIALAENDVAEPVSFTEAVFPLQITAAIQSLETLGITDETNLDGQATISVVYL